MARKGAVFGAFNRVFKGEETKVIPCWVVVMNSRALGEPRCAKCAVIGNSIAVALDPRAGMVLSLCVSCAALLR